MSPPKTQILAENRWSELRGCEDAANSLCATAKSIINVIRALQDEEPHRPWDKGQYEKLLATINACRHGMLDVANRLQKLSLDQPHNTELDVSIARIRGLVLPLCTILSELVPVPKREHLIQRRYSSFQYTPPPHPEGRRRVNSVPIAHAHTEIVPPLNLGKRP